MLETQKGAITPRLSEEKRLLFARQHRHWKFEDWCNVLFSDESPYQVFYIPNSRNATVWGSQEENVPVASQVKFIVRLFLRGEVGPYDSLRINATTLCTSAYIK